jgi:hypothetical protein
MVALLTTWEPRLTNRKPKKAINSVHNKARAGMFMRATFQRQYCHETSFFEH